MEEEYKAKIEDEIQKREEMEFALEEKLMNEKASPVSARVQ